MSYLVNGKIEVAMLQMWSRREKQSIGQDAAKRLPWWSRVLLLALVGLRRRLDDAMRTSNRRSLPFSELIFDRWVRAKKLGFGTNSSIYDSSIVFGDVRVGSNTWIGPNTLLDGSAAPLSIGDYCSISAGVHIYTHDTVDWALTGGEAKKTSSPVIVCDCCYIAPQCIIAAGVSIGKHSIVAANSFVKDDIPDFSIYGGSPAKEIGKVEINNGTVIRKYLVD